MLYAAFEGTLPEIVGDQLAAAILVEDTRAAVARIEHEKLFEQATHVGATCKIKIADKLRALEVLGKWHKLKLFSEKVEISGALDTISDDELEQRLAKLVTDVKPAS